MKVLLQIILVPVVLALALFLYARFVEPSVYDINLVRIDAGFADARVVRIAAFGDAHLGNGTGAGKLSAVVDRINKLEPDVVLFLGDLFDNYEEYQKDPAEIAAVLSRLEGEKFAVYGNHDLGGGARRAYEQVLDGAGFTLLCNEQVLLDSGVNVIGLDDMIFGKPDHEGLTRSNAFNLMMVHEPDYGAQFETRNIGLQVSGHTHGGQIRIPMVGSLVSPPYGEVYTRGMHKTETGGLLYVNRGIGMSQLPMRFFASPEITVFELY